MKSSEVIKHFKSRLEVSAALGVSYEAVRKWGEYPPLGRQYQIQALTNGKLKAEPESSKRTAK